MAAVFDTRLEAATQPQDPCDHLVVREARAGRIVARCRVLSPLQALRNGGNLAGADFDLALLIVLRERMVEVEDPALAIGCRPEAVMSAVWSAIARYLIDRRLDYVLATPRVSTRDGGHVAASLHRQAWLRAMSPEDYRVFPRRRLPLERLSDMRPVTAPPVLKSFLERGAWLCGEPALDPRREHAAFPMLVPLARLQDRHTRRFLAEAA
jgi:putative hemolysin